MTFTEQLQVEAEKYFQNIYKHPFVQGLKNDKLTSEQLIQYVAQNYQLLHTFIQVYAIAITKSHLREEMSFFQRHIQFILHEEKHPHRSLCEAAGIEFDLLKEPSPLAPSTRNYINHLLVTAQSGTLADLYATILAASWTYSYIAEQILAENPPDPDHPFSAWVQFYASKEVLSMNQELKDRLDHIAENLHFSEQNRLKESFLISCDHEYNFWNMAYQIESYPFMS